MARLMDHVKAMAAHVKGKPLTTQGAEVPDPVPMAPPIGYKREPSLFETVRDMVRSEQLRAAAEEQGFETLEEADDFDIGDDYDPRSPYEIEFDPGDPAAADDIRKRLRAEQAAGERPGAPATESSGGDPGNAPGVPRQGEEVKQERL